MDWNTVLAIYLAGWVSCMAAILAFVLFVAPHLDERRRRRRKIQIAESRLRHVRLS